MATAGWIYSSQSTGGGNHVVYNERGRFIAANHHWLPASDANLASAATFGDLDRDGKLDVFLGNWTSGDWTPFPPEASRDIILWQREDGFVTQALDFTPGETLTALLSDFDVDGDLDVLAGIDFHIADLFLRSDGQGGLTPIGAAGGVIPVIPQSTMSIDVADINNDLRPEIFLSQITGGAPGQQGRLSVRSIADVCNEYQDEAWKARTVRARRHSDARYCLGITDLVGRDECIAVALVRRAVQSKDVQLCRTIPDRWQDLAFICEQSFAMPAASRAEPDGGALRQQRNQNVLLMPEANGTYTDRAVEMGVDVTGWSWTAKFADVDNDEWQDLYVVNGLMQSDRRTSNVFFSNRAGKSFEERTEAVGLTSHLVTGSYVYADLDNDGDLDIVSVAADGPIWVHKNGTHGNYAIAFELRDEVGNRFGLGSRIVIRYGSDEGRQQMRELKAGGGFLSYDPPSAHFGLARTTEVARVEIHWSTGETTDLAGPFAAGHRYRITRKRSADAAVTLRVDDRAAD